MAPRRELGSTEHWLEWEFACVCNSSLAWKESRNSGRSFPYKTASPVAKLKGSCRFLFRRCSSPSSFLQGGGKKRWKQHEHLLWARQNHPPNSETGAHSPALAFLRKMVLDWAGCDAAGGGPGLWGAHGEVCMAQGRAACPELTPGSIKCVCNHLLRAVLLIPPATGGQVLPSASHATQPPFPPHAPSNPRATCAESRQMQPETQRYSRQGSLLGNDAVGLAPFVHQPRVGLHPHPAALLGQQPENR